MRRRSYGCASRSSTWYHRDPYLQPMRRRRRSTKSGVLRWGSWCREILSADRAPRSGLAGRRGCAGSAVTASVGLRVWMLWMTMSTFSSCSIQLLGLWLFRESRRSRRSKTMPERRDRDQLWRQQFAWLQRPRLTHRPAWPHGPAATWHTRRSTDRLVSSPSRRGQLEAAAGGR